MLRGISPCRGQIHAGVNLSMHPNGGLHGWRCCLWLHFTGNVQHRLRDFAEVPSPAAKTAAVDCPDTGIVRKKPPCGGCSQGNGGGLFAKGKEKVFIEKKLIYRNGKAA